MVENQEHYPRDLRGYAGQPPHARWPGGARIAVQFVLNYEEGAENHVLHGDAGVGTVPVRYYWRRQLPGTPYVDGFTL
ncbi:putative polysaccharide deacetylase [Klebsiella variicola]|nr:putative polysaccharide deacetylase [Klebsiella variicola]